jgi:Zn-dependent M28 family amino/carboxypeptidase
MPILRYSMLFVATFALTAARADTARMAGDHVFASEITAEDFAAHVKVLASDAFGGRGVTTDGEAKSLQYLRGQFQAMGLAPGNGDSYFQTVPFQARVGDFSRSVASIAINGKVAPLAFGPQIVLGTDTGKAEVTMTASPMAFVGYGINAPDQNWNDYADIDVSGKTVLILAGEPVGGSTEPGLFEGRRLSSYARWGYKVEEAARHGAVAAIMIHDLQGAGYDWKGVQMRWQTEFSLRREAGGAPVVAVQGWINGDSARSLFAAAGMSLPELREAAGHRGFKARALPNASFSAALKGRILIGESHNVIAKLVGSRYPDEAVLYSAHWDHLGTQSRASGDNIYNGALDNASGVAAVLEIAGRFAAQQPKPERSVLFLLPTLEEFGLLGSSYYTRHPVVPLANTVADINFDMVVPVGRARNFVVIGLGLSELDEVVSAIVARHGRAISAEKASEPDHFFRSDHFSFAKAGVPVLYMRGGVESDDMAHFEAARDELWNHTAAVYHTPNDEFKTNWDLRGVADDLTISYETGAALASSREWPNYRQGQAFRALRDASRPSAGSASSH